MTDEDVRQLSVGQMVSLSGIVYAARDAAHRRLVRALAEGKDPPFPLAGQVLYYVGPAPARPGKVAGPAGPTTASRLDCYTPDLLARGLKGMIGKGSRGTTVRAALVTHRAIYFVAVGGAAALLAERIRSEELIAYPSLGPEAIRRLELEDFPVVVANDIWGRDLFELGKARYRQRGLEDETD